MSCILYRCPVEGWPNRKWASHLFLQEGLGWLGPVRSFLKRKPVTCRILIHNFLLPHVQKLETYFTLFIFLNYCTLWLTVMKFKTITICQSGITQKINISQEVALFSSLTLPYQKIELWINSEAMNLPISFVFILSFCNFRETQAVRFKKCSESKPDVMFLDQTNVST